MIIRMRFAIYSRTNRKSFVSEEENCDLLRPAFYESSHHRPTLDRLQMDTRIMKATYGRGDEAASRTTLM